MALHIVQEDGPGAEAKVRVAWGVCGLATAQLLAHHLGIMQVPPVVTHRPPAAAIVHLHAALAAIPSTGELQADAWGEAHGLGSLQPSTLQSPDGTLQQAACMVAARPGMGLVGASYLSNTASLRWALKLWMQVRIWCQ